MFIAIEGIEGSGKSTQALLLVEYLCKLGIEVVHTREPGGTLIAEKIREIFLDQTFNEKITPHTELLLMFAARSQHLTNLILPSLAANKYVICERFTDASFAYQGGGRGLNFEYIQFLTTVVQKNFKPDLVLLFDLEVNIALDRIKKRGKLDRLEQEQADFFNRIRSIYLQRAASDPKRYHVIDANVAPTAVTHQMITILQQKITNLAPTKEIADVQF